MSLRRYIREIYTMFNPTPLEEIYKIRGEIEELFTRNDNTIYEDAFVEYFPEYPYLDGSDVLYRVRNISDIEIDRILRHYEPYFDRYVHPKPGIEPSTCILIEYIARTWTEDENKDLIEDIQTILNALTAGSDLDPSVLGRIETRIERFQHPLLRKEG